MACDADNDVDTDGCLEETVVHKAHVLVLDGGIDPVGMETVK
jgi:hypothetical protein